MSQPAAAPQPGTSVNLHQLLKTMIEKGASDLHLTAGSPPQIRIDGGLVPLRLPPLSPADTKQLCYSVLTDQRDVGSDTESFKRSLKHILRQDPDVVLVGEMRDLETVEAALTIAETGHLAFATLHTNSCVQTINRIVDVFPPHAQSQVRA